MKKILAAILLVFSVTALGACNQTTEPSYVLNDPNRDTPIYNEWVGQVTYEETPVVVREDQTAGGYEVSLPTDMASASRYVLTSLEAKEADNYTINELKIPSLELMERAGRGIFNELIKLIDSDKTILGTKMNGEIIDGVLNFFVNYDTYVYKVEVEKEFMEDLKINNN